MSRVLIFLILLSFSCTPSIKGKYISESSGLISEFTFQNQYCHFKYFLIGEIAGKYETDNGYIYIETNSELGTISLEIVNEYTLKGQGWASGIFIKEGYEKEYYKALLGYYVVTSSKLNVRVGSSTSKKVLGTLKKGDKVDVIEVVNRNWYKVMTGSGEGYVSSKYLEMIP